MSSNKPYIINRNYTTRNNQSKIPYVILFIGLILATVIAYIVKCVFNTYNEVEAISIIGSLVTIIIAVISFCIFIKKIAKAKLIKTQLIIMAFITVLFVITLIGCLYFVPVINLTFLKPIIPEIIKENPVSSSSTPESQPVDEEDGKEESEDEKEHPFPDPPEGLQLSNEDAGKIPIEIEPNDVEDVLFLGFPEVEKISKGQKDFDSVVNTIEKKQLLRIVPVSSNFNYSIYYGQLTAAANIKESSSELEELRALLEEYNKEPDEFKKDVLKTDYNSIIKMLDEVIEVRVSAKKELGGSDKELSKVLMYSYITRGDYNAIFGEIELALSDYTNAISELEILIKYLHKFDTEDKLSNPSLFGAYTYILGDLYAKISRITTSNWNQSVESALISSIYYQIASRYIGIPNNKFLCFYYSGMMSHRLVYQFQASQDATVFIIMAESFYSEANNMSDDNIELLEFMGNLEEYKTAHEERFGDIDS